MSATRGVEVVVRSGSELFMMRETTRQSSEPLLQTKPRSLTTVEDALVHVASENPRKPALKRLNRRSLDLGPGEDKVSFKRGTGESQDEVWTLSRKKLDALRTLSSSSMVRRTELVRALPFPLIFMVHRRLLVQVKQIARVVRRLNSLTRNLRSTIDL